MCFFGGDKGINLGGLEIFSWVKSKKIVEVFFIDVYKLGGKLY